MKRKRGPFMTFILSCIPGAGQMYLGFFQTSCLMFVDEECDVL